MVQSWKQELDDKYNKIKLNPQFTNYDLNEANKVILEAVDKLEGIIKRKKIKIIKEGVI